MRMSCSGMGNQKISNVPIWKRISSRDRSLSTDLYAECKIDKQSGDEMGPEFETM